MITQTTTAADGASSTVVSKSPRAVNWTVVSIIVMQMLLFVALATVTTRLTPARYCGAQVGAAKMQGQLAPVQDCTAIITDMLAIQRVEVIGLLVALVIGYLIQVAMVLGAKVDLSGMGWTFGVGGEKPKADQ